MNKIPLVLLPGLLSDYRVWKYQIKHLGELTSEIIVPNLNQADTPQKMVNAVLAVAPHTFALAGHSMGGWLALEIIRQHSQSVKKLCLLNTTASLDSPEKAQNRLNMIAAINAGKGEQVINQLLPAFVYNPAMQNKVKDMFRQNLPAFHSQQRAMLARGDCSQLLKDIACPTLIVHARHDSVFAFTESQKLAKIFSNAKLALIEDSGHMSPVEMPEAVTALMRYWLEYF